MKRLIKLHQESLLNSDEIFGGVAVELLWVGSETTLWQAGGRAGGQSQNRSAVSRPKPIATAT